MGLLGSGGDVMTSIELLKMQMKMQYKTFDTTWGPGHWLKFAKQAMTIMKDPDCDTKSKIQCQIIIRDYVYSLDNANREMNNQGKTPTHSSMMLHSFFLCDLQHYDPDWVQSLVETCPHAFMHVGQEWCAWTTILR